MYLIGSITFNVLARKSIESESRQLAARGDLGDDPTLDAIALLVIARAAIDAV
jgi:hypothetical protein